MWKPDASAGRIDDAVVRDLYREKLDWRFKGMPSDAFGLTCTEFLERQPRLFESGFTWPLLTLDRPALEHNLRTMSQWCARHGILLAPHGKTTMAPRLFQLQLEHGAWGMTAANLSQLRVYRAFGVNRILLANQLLDPHGLRWVASELDTDPDWSLACWVDSVRGVELMTESLAESAPGRPLDVLVELGAPNARAGVRTPAEALAVARAVVDSPWLRLAGVAGYEGALTGGLDEQSLAEVDAFLDQLRATAVDLVSSDLIETDEILVTCGGSAYFDQVTEALTTPWPIDRPVLPVLRSGSYLTHDDGLYRRLGPFGREHRLPGAEASLRPALRIWAEVTSYPEPGMVLLTMGRRDVSYDQDLPEPQALRPRGGDERALPSGACRVSRLADQHAFLDVESDLDLRIGDRIGFGLSHPCTVFDRWPLIPVVENDTVVDLVRTFF